MKLFSKWRTSGANGRERSSMNGARGGNLKLPSKSRDHFANDKKPWLFGVLRGLYCPVHMGITLKHYSLVLQIPFQEVFRP